jgi:hypothetical protein
LATNKLHIAYESTKQSSQLTDAGFDGKILAHHAKAGYDYPTIRLPLAFSGLIGLPTRIYQTVHEGALAFLVVVSSSPDKHENVPLSAKPSVFTRRRSGVRIASSPSVFLSLLTIKRGDALR